MEERQYARLLSPITAKRVCALRPPSEWINIPAQVSMTCENLLKRVHDLE